MFHLTKSAQKVVADLRKQRPNALQYANAVARMNFEKPFTAFAFVGNFTANSVKKLVTVRGEWVAVLFMQHKRYGTGSVYSVMLSSDASKFDRHKEYTPYGHSIDTFYSAADFDEARKANAGKVFVVAQAVEHLNSKPVPRTPDYLTALQNGERFRVAGTKYSRLYVRRIDGRGEQYEAEISRGGWRYGNYGRALSILSEPIDKSGFCPVPAVEERLRKASALRCERAAAAAAAYDCSEAENRIAERIEQTRAALSAYLCNYTGGVGEWDAGTACRDFIAAVNALNRHKTAHAAGKYADVQHVNHALAEIETALQKVADFINPPAEQPEEAAAPENERPEIICVEAAAPEATAEPVAAEQPAEQPEEAAAEIVAETAHAVEDVTEPQAEEVAEPETPETISNNNTQEVEPMKHVYTFAADTVTVNGKTFPAAYSVTPSRSVMLFLTVPDAAEPIRVKITPDAEQYADALSAAEGRVEVPAEINAPAVETVAEAAPAVDVTEQQTAEVPEPIEQQAEAPAEDTEEPAEIVTDADEAASAEIVTEAAPAEVVTEQQAAERAEIIPAPIKDKDRHGEIPAKDFIGDCISGEGWCIVFDKAMQRTRVIIKNPSKAARDAIKAAGFYWSPKAGSWNKKLTHRAHRAAEALAKTLAAVC